MSSFYFNYLVKTKTIAKKLWCFSIAIGSYYRPREEKNWYGIGGWGKKPKHWLKLLAISTYKIDFALDGSHIQTCGEVGVDFHRGSYICTWVVGGYSTKFYARGGSALKSNDLPFHIPFLTEKVSPTPFVYLLLTNDSPFHIPSFFSGLFHNRDF